MGLGKILGSISPAFGMLSGKGMFGQLPLNAMGQSGLGGLLGMLLSHGSHGGDDGPAPTPAPGAMPGGLTSANVGQMAPGSLPAPSAMDNIGSAMSGAHGNTDPSAGLGFSQAPQIQHGGLQAVLQSLGLL